MVANNLTMRSLLQGVDYRVARSVKELELAYRLVYQEYVKQGYMNENAAGMRLSIHNALPETTTFVAMVDDVVVATASVIPDSPLGLPMDELYHMELNELRDREKKICEVSMLASSSDLFSAGVPLMLNAKKMFLVFFLFKHIFDYVRTHLDCDYICITVNPKHANTYDSLFFKNLGELKYYSKVNGAPALAKYLDVHAVNTQCAINGRQGLYKMFLAGNIDPENFSGKVRLEPDDLKYFFSDQISAFREVPQEQLAYIKQCYPKYDFSEIISQRV
jgi:hypothetical protein